MIEKESELIIEALVREIRDAGRWCAVVEAWQALLSVRRKAKSLMAEVDYLSGTKGVQEEKRNEVD